MIDKQPYGYTPAGEQASVYTLTGGGITVRICDFGATVLGIDVPDAEGNVADVVLGFADIEGYAGENGAFYGATAGPIANRTALAEVPIDGTVYHLPKNDSEVNNLHTDKDHGLHKRLWRAEAVEADGAQVLTLTCELADGEFGLPGNRVVTAVYSLAATGTLTLTYRMESDAPTFANITNHSYFNLAGHDAGEVDGQLLQINAQAFLPITAQSIPTGELRDVDGTPFDFREAHAIGDAIADDDAQIERGRGYDHCFVVSGYESEGGLRHAVHAEDPASGRALDVCITAPGIQLYTGNWLEDPDAKAGAHYTPRCGFALEPEFYPDCVHHEDWPQPTCRPGEPFETVIQYEFSLAE